MIRSMNTVDRDKRVYLDWAAASPLHEEVFFAMEPYLRYEYGNPGSIHKEGSVAKNAVTESRISIARILGIRPNEVFFTASGTEANNLAVHGLLNSLIEKGLNLSELEVITTRIEHPSILQVLEYLITRGLNVKYVSVNTDGLIDTNQLQNFLNEKTCLVTFSYANSEIGVIQPVGRITRIVNKYNKDKNADIKVHVDAAQAPLWLTCQMHQLGVDLMTLDSGKCQGPKGVGVLAKLAKVEIRGIVYGGGQESGLRAGTENVAGIVGAAKAIEIAQKDWSVRANKVSLVRDEGIKILLEAIPNAVLNGTIGENRLANNINISIPNFDTEFVVVVLDKNGFAVSTRSACRGAGGGESAVVKEISDDPARASSTLRITLGPNTTTEEIKKLTCCLADHVEKMKHLTQG